MDKVIDLNKDELRLVLTQSHKFISDLEEFCNFPEETAEDEAGQKNGADEWLKDSGVSKPGRVGLPGGLTGQNNGAVLTNWLKNRALNTSGVAEKINGSAITAEKKNGILSATGKVNKVIKPVLDSKNQYQDSEEMETEPNEISMPGISKKKVKKLKIQEMKSKKAQKRKLRKQEKEKEKKQNAILQMKIKKEAIRNGNVKLENIPGGDRTNIGGNKTGKIDFNKNNVMVFNKIDLSGLGKDESGNKKSKLEKDPKQLLENIKKSASKVNELEKSGEIVKAAKFKEKGLWMSALKRAEGVKVKDDADLLKKTMRKQKNLKNQRKKKWDERIEAVEKQKEERQKKREDNIAARKKEKKKNKIKKSFKKGRVVL